MENEQNSDVLKDLDNKNYKNKKSFNNEKST